MKRPSGTRRERPRAGPIAPARGRFCPGDRAHRGAPCSLPRPLARARRARPRTSRQGPAAGRKAPAVPGARAAAGPRTAEPACLACAFPDRAGLQRKRAITGMLAPVLFPPARQSAPPGLGIAGGAGGEGGREECGHFIAAMPCMPAACAGPLHPQDRRRSANGSRTARRPWILASPRIRTLRPFWRWPSRLSRKVRACRAEACGVIRAAALALGPLRRIAIADLRAAAETKMEPGRQNRRGPAKAAAAAATRPANRRPQGRCPLPDFRRAALGDGD